jgi:hypothetical protein
VALQFSSMLIGHIYVNCCLKGGVICTHFWLFKLDIALCEIDKYKRSESNHRLPNKANELSLNSYLVEGEVISSRPIGCVCNLLIKKKKNHRLPNRVYFFQLFASSPCEF